MSVENKTFKTKEICDIIKQCSESGVSNFEYGNLKFSLKDKEIINIPEPTTFQGHETETNDIIDHGASFIDDEEELEVSELDLRVRQIDEAVLADPSLAEELLSCEDLLEGYVDSIKGSTNAELESR